MKEEPRTRVFRRCFQRARKDNVAGIRPAPLFFWIGTVREVRWTFRSPKNPKAAREAAHHALVLSQVSSARF